MVEETEIRSRIKELRDFQGLPSELDPIYRELLAAFKAYRVANPEEPNTEKYTLAHYTFGEYILKLGKWVWKQGKLQRLDLPVQTKRHY